MLKFDAEYATRGKITAQVQKYVTAEVFQQKTLFHVVEFLEEAEGGSNEPVVVIPDSWLLAFKDASGCRMCNWPPKSVKVDASFIIKAKKPDSSWSMHPIRLHKSLSNYQKASQICERLKEMSEVESDDTNTPTQPKRTRMTPITFRDAQLTDSEGEEDAEESLCDDHSGMQQCPPPLPHSLPPVVVSSRVSQSSSCRKSTVSLLPSPRQCPLSGFRPASIGTHNPLEAKLEKLEKIVLQQLSLLEEMKNDTKDLKRRFEKREKQNQDQQGTRVWMQEQNQEEHVTRGKLPEGFQFPLQSSEEVERLELDLKTDSEKQTHLECHLAMCGGLTFKQVMRGILSALFSTGLARSYNFCGQRGKKGLSNHPFILETIHSAARKSYPEATDADLQVFISSWLYNARDRDQGRRQRFMAYKSVNRSGVEEGVKDK